MKASHAVAANFRQLIALGELKAGDSLSMERELVDRLGSASPLPEVPSIEEVKAG
jgi:DNA-binding FadR family transcriptional regulator